MSRAIKLLHIAPTFGMGGQQRRLALIAAALGAKYAHEIVSLSDDLAARALLPADQAIPINVLPLRKTSLPSPQNVSRLATVIGAAAPDIVCTYNWGAIEAVLANRFRVRLPHIHFEDGFGPDETIDRQNWKRVLARRWALSDAVTVVPSQTLMTLATARWRLAPERLRYLPNGVDAGRFAPSPDPSPDPSPGPEQTGKVIVGTVGALRREKNYARLIRASAAAPNVVLEIYGDGPERAALEAVAGDGVFFHGPTDTPEAAYASFDVFALSSDTEQMPISLIEAMACGLPVVATDVGDIAAMVSPENRAFVTPLGDDDAYRRAICDLAGEPALRRRLGDANRRKAIDDYSLERMTGAYDQLFRELAGAARG